MQHKIHRIELPANFGMGTVNCYLLVGEYNTLVDCGEKSKASWKALIDGLKKIGLEVDDIDKIVITHAHVDHMGMANKVAHESGAKVFVSDLVHNWAINLEETWARRTKVFSSTFKSEVSSRQRTVLEPFLKGAFGRVLDYWDNIDSSLVSLFHHDSVLNMSGQDYQSIHCPGHSWSQTCFLNEKNGDFLAADMLLRVTPTPVIDYDPKNESERIRGMQQMLQSFEMVKNLDIQTVYPGHYDIMYEHDALITRQLHRIQVRKNQCLQLIREGTRTCLEIFNSLYANPMNIPGLMMTFGYLDLLQDEGLIERIQTGDGATYKNL